MCRTGWRRRASTGPRCPRASRPFACCRAPVLNQPLLSCGTSCSILMHTELSLAMQHGRLWVEPMIRNAASTRSSHNAMTGIPVALRAPKRHNLRRHRPICRPPALRRSCTPRCMIPQRPEATHGDSLDWEGVRPGHIGDHSPAHVRQLHVVIPLLEAEHAVQCPTNAARPSPSITRPLIASRALRLLH